MSLFERLFGPSLTSAKARIAELESENAQLHANLRAAAAGELNLVNRLTATEYDAANLKESAAVAWQKEQAAEARAQAAEARSVAALAEARMTLVESYALSKVAARALFGIQQDADIENPPSVAEADRRAAAKAREARERQ